MKISLMSVLLTSCGHIGIPQLLQSENVGWKRAAEQRKSYHTVNAAVGIYGTSIAQFAHSETSPV